MVICETVLIVCTVRIREGVELSMSKSLTVFYDGACPICCAEMASLERYDQGDVLSLVDVHSEEFVLTYPHIQKTQAMHVLHAQDASGNVLKGVDANIAAWAAIGRKRWLRWLRLPVLKQLSDWAYMRFANNRYWISSLLMPASRCASGPRGRCTIKKQSRP